MSYTPTTWAAGDTVTAAKLNKLEQGVAAAGGVLVVHETVSDITHTLDKTWQEIVDAEFAVLYIVTRIGTDVYALYHFGIDSGLYEIWFNGQQGLFTYSTDSATGYPSYEE